MPGSTHEKQRLQTLAEFGLLEAESVPVFEEATQTAAHFLDAPICVLGLLDQDRQWLKSAVGLSRIGLMNELAASRQLPRSESFCAYVVDSHQALAISDTVAHPGFASSVLVQRYGIRAYLGVPLLTSNGYCLGTLAVMELSPRNFTVREIELLELTARWSMSEFERNRLVKTQQDKGSDRSVELLNHAVHPLASSIKASLISQMTQELRTPLTSILGMASVLNREIYGPLTDKQKEYMDIVHHSGQYLLSLVNEILELGALNDCNSPLNLAAVDIEMLCQQALSVLAEAAQRREQHLKLSVEPGSRIWLLDKDKVRQILYHLVFSVIQSSSTDSVIRVHIARKRDCLNLTVWTSHPWLGEGLPQAELFAHQLFDSTSTLPQQNQVPDRSMKTHSPDAAFSSSTTVFPQANAETQEINTSIKLSNTRQNLGLMLSRQLAESHGGTIKLQGSVEAGYRYVVTLPQKIDLEHE